MGIFLLCEDAFALISLIHAIVVSLLSITITQYIENNISFNSIAYGDLGTDNLPTIEPNILSASAASLATQLGW